MIDTLATVLRVLFLLGAIPAFFLMRNRRGKLAGVLFLASAMITAACFVGAFSGGQLSGGQIEAVVSGFGATILMIGVAFGSLVGVNFRKQETPWADGQDPWLLADDEHGEAMGRKAKRP